LTEKSKKLTAARLWFEEEPRSWLLILDNVHRDTVPFLREHLPRRNVQGNILFTTRTEDVARTLVDIGGDPRRRMIHLSPMEIQDAASLLLKDADMNIEMATPSLFAQAEELVKCVGRLPLAVVHAASFMRQSGTSLNHMVALYKGEQRMDVSKYI
jgi:NB-ARC domain